MKHLYILITLMALSIDSIKGQDITTNDYERAVDYLYANYNNKKVFNLDTQINWHKDNTGFWFIDHSEKGIYYKTMDIKTYRIKFLFDHYRVANAINEFSQKETKANELLLYDIEKPKEGQLSFVHDGQSYVLDLLTYKLRISEEKEEEENRFESKSLDGKWIAYAEDYNLFIKSTTTEQKYQLSFDGRKNYEYGSLYGWYEKMEGENGNRPEHFNVNWSKDSKWISTNVVDLQHAEKMYLLDYSIDSLFRPKLLSYYRGSPGDTTMVHVKPVFFNVESKSEVRTNLPRGTHINSVSVEWTEEPGVALAYYLERGFKKGYLKRINLNTNLEQILVTETSSTNIDNFEYRYLKEKQKIAFLSERNGWRQLYLLDIRTNKTTSLTGGNYYISRIEYIDEKNETIYFIANGKEQGNNPYHSQLYKANFQGKVTLLTPELMNHDISFSADGKHFVDSYSTINTPTKTVLRKARSGQIIKQITEADISRVVAEGWRSPEVFELTAKDGKTTIYGAIWKPTNFDSSMSYPLIDHTYTGPHTHMFPERFSGAFRNQALAELGFIVMVIDGLGTSKRSKEFHNHSYKNMGNNLEDHVLAIKHLGAKYSWINTDKVGIFGHSAGGFDTGRAMLAFPDVYKVGVASSADHDFRMEKAWWPEMYQGWPVDSTYHKVSNITNAKNLKGKLLLVHGGMDDNVNPSATFKLVEALIKEDKEFDLLILPSQRHIYGGKHRNYFMKKRWNYFVEHLKAETPIWNFEW
ncbi:prolyl oligopeptidase family serine peptidase [Maribacter sp.]|uniref:S9 family peptidase n=1 Tax=Maribacter sp. TaxID=1897614 RepID=UPI0025B89762|nr:prolyl oligopeptidase family serine peptidase [Maribacter sp.]